MDAISFVLGVQSRHLRSTQLKDLIFRPPGNTRSNLRARATLVYQDANDPNVELRFSRVISTKGTGEYQVNGKTVSFAKYEEALKDIGVLLKGRNFLVFQGDVESTARKSPKELVEWFEEISSSADLKESYNEALEKMQETEATARAAAQKQKGIWKKRRELKGQKEEADKFRGLVESKAKLLTDFFLWQLFHIRADIEDKEGGLDEMGEEMDEVNQHVEEMTEKVRLAKKDASAARNATSKLEKKRVKLAAEIDKCQPSIIKVQEEVKNLEKKIAAEKKTQTKITKEAEMREETLKALEKEIAEYTETEEHLQQEYDDLKKQSEFSLTEDQEAEYERIREAAVVASAKPRQTLGAANRKLDSARAKAATLSEEMKELMARKHDVSNKVKELTERKDILEESIEKTKKELQSRKDELESLQKSIQEDREKRIAIDAELEQINHRLRDMRDDRRSTDNEARIEETIASLKRYFPGVKGRLVKLCQPTMKRYDLAVTVAGGKDMDAVVVDTKQTAFDCIQYLRTNQIGTATFLPLDSLQVPNPASTESIRAMLENDSRYRLACDVIACSDDSVKKAVMYAVGNSVVCENLDCARELCFGRNNSGGSEESRMKAVTLGGAVISKAGTMTGGVSNDDKARAGRWNDREVENLRKRKEELESNLSEIDSGDAGLALTDRRTSRGGRTSKLEELRNHVGNLTNRLQYTESDLEFTKKKLKEQNVLLTSTSEQEEKVNKSIKAIESEIVSLDEKVQRAIKLVKEAEEEYFGPFRKKTGMKDFRAYDEAVGKSREEYLKKRRTIREHLEKLKAQKKYEDERNFDDILSKKENTLQSLKKKLSDTKSREEDIMKSLSELKAKLADLESEIDEAVAVEKSKETEVTTAQEGYKVAQAEQKKIGKMINTEESNLERLRAKLHETLQKARVEEAEIPLLDLEDSEESVGQSTRSSRTNRENQNDDDLQQGSVDMMTQGTVASVHFSQPDDSRVIKDRNDANMVDFSSLRSELKQRISEKKEKDLHNKFTDDIEKITAQIDGMTPNMKAGDAFDAVLEQLEECNEDFNDAKNAAKMATMKFEEIKQERSKKFNDAFQHIATALTTIYKDMTKSSKHPLGGNAYLSLDDAEEPYNGGIKFTAMPPMKRYRDMEYLSGGEKTIAALALLFAIHSYHPAPFFVMDEVDAALDNVNVLKLCNYIRQRSKDFQCIVISLKDMFYEQSQSLVGICRNVATNSSRTLTLDLTKFDRDQNTEGASGKRSRSSSVGPRKRTSTSEHGSKLQ